MRTLKALAASSLLLFATVSCGLLDTAFTIDTDWVYIKLDTAQMGIKLSAGATKVPAIPCTSDKACGAAFSCSGSSYSCTMKCVSKKCEIHVTAETGTKVDLSQKIKNQTSATVLSEVELDYVVYNTDSNSLTFATPSIGLYVGPQTATTTAGATSFATMPAIPAKETPNAKIPVTSAGKSALEGYVRNYKTPFKLLGKAALTFKSGDPAPTGKIALKFKAYFKIDPLN